MGGPEDAEPHVQVEAPLSPQLSFHPGTPSRPAHGVDQHRSEEPSVGGGDLPSRGYFEGRERRLELARADADVLRAQTKEGIRNAGVTGEVHLEDAANPVRGLPADLWAEECQIDVARLGTIRIHSAGGDKAMTAEREAEGAKALVLRGRFRGLRRCAASGLLRDLVGAKRRGDVGDGAEGQDHGPARPHHHCTTHPEMRPETAPPSARPARSRRTWPLAMLPPSVHARVAGFQ